MKNLTKKTALALIHLSLLISLQSCFEWSWPTSSPVNYNTHPYGGLWNASFYGGYTGTMNVNIDSQWGTLYASGTLTDQNGNSYSFYVSGSVDNQGNLSGGYMNHQGVQVGNMTGSFSGNAGGSWWTEKGISGTWSANRL